MAQYKYRAFLSYSHSDKDAARRLHRNLERYRTPAAILRAAGAAVPKALRPIFRDRDDTGAGHSLNEQVTKALGESEALVVLCSPNSAKSPYVNEEIRTFKRLGRETRVLPIILSGEPGSASAECFPQALRERVGTNGKPTGEHVEPLAADMRNHGDGPYLAELKLVSGLLGVDLNTLRRREEIERRKRQGMWAGIALSMAVLAVVSLVSLVLMFQWKEAEAVARVNAVSAELAAKRSQAETEIALGEKAEALGLAETRLQQVYELTMRMVITEAQARRIPEQTFYESIIDAKSRVEWFGEFLQSYFGQKDEDQVYIDLSRALIRLAGDPQEQLGDNTAKLAWAQHALGVLERRSDARPEVDADIVRVRQVIDRLRASP